MFVECTGWSVSSPYPPRLPTVCESLNVFGPQKLTGSGGGWITQTFNSDLEAGGHTFNLGYTSVRSVSL